MFNPIAKRAKEAGLILAFENCGQTHTEVIALVQALGVADWGMAWDVFNNMHNYKSGSKEEEKYFLDSLPITRIVHVKAQSVLPELEGAKVPWECVLRGVKATGRDFTGPLIVTGHSRDGKSALCAGIFDERFSVVAPAGSGCGDAGCARYTGTCDGSRQDPERSKQSAVLQTFFPPGLQKHTVFTAHRFPLTPFAGQNIPFRWTRICFGLRALRRR